MVRVKQRGFQDTERKPLGHKVCNPYHMSESREGGHKQLISNGRRFKLAFAERDKKHTIIATKAGGIDSLESGDSWAP
jgi:hypothetical protein